MEPADQLRGLGVEAGFGSFGPGFHLFQKSEFLARRFVEEQAGAIDGFLGRFFGLVIIRVVLIHPVDLPLENATGRLQRRPALLGIAQ